MMRASYFIVGFHMCFVCFVLVLSSNHHHYYDHDDDDDHHYHYHHDSIERDEYGGDIFFRIGVQSVPINLGW